MNEYLLYHLSLCHKGFITLRPLSTLIAEVSSFGFITLVKSSSEKSFGFITLVHCLFPYCCGIGLDIMTIRE